MGVLEVKPSAIKLDKLQVNFLDCGRAGSMEGDLKGGNHQLRTFMTGNYFKRKEFDLSVNYEAFKSLYSMQDITTY